MINDTHSFLINAKKAVLIAYPKTNLDVRDLGVIWFDEKSDPWRAVIFIDGVEGVCFDVTYDGTKKHTSVTMWPEADRVIVSDLQLERHRNL